MKNIIPFVWVSLVLFLSIRLEAPIKVLPADTDGFSALNTQAHLDTMASEIHFMGTPENRKVRDYILSEFAKLEIPTELFRGYTKTEFRSRAKKMAETDNIIATIKTPGASKAILIAAHYDSVLNSPGAADDVHAVACILEVARLLKDTEHKNDIIFLITDGEEMGLLGAKAFVETKNLDNIGLVLNYEARGNSGAGFFFEWSEGNEWLVRHLRKATRRPVSNSLAYEIYKRLPNDSDFTHFKNAGLRGINHAFIDGFTYYHNPADKPEAINMNSVQHTGENMWRLAKYFSNIDLTEETNGKDASFTNFMGLLVIYPASFDFVLILLLVFLLFANFYISIKRKLSIQKILIYCVMLALIIITAVMINIGLSILLTKLYPQYDVFYTGQFYNHKWYILCSAGISLILFSLISHIAKKSNDLDTFKQSSLILLTALSIFIFLQLPTATYLICIPSIAIGLMLLWKNKETKNNLLNDIIRYTLSMIPLAIWGPVLITLFLAFSIKLLFVPSVIAFLISITVLVFFEQMWNTKIIKVAGPLFLMGGFFIAHIFSNPNVEKPLPSSLYYSYNTDDNKTYWLTNDSKLNFANEAMLEDAKHLNLNLPYPRTVIGKETNPVIGFELPQIHIDSLDSNTISMNPNLEVFKTIVYLEDGSNLKSLKLNDHEAMDLNSDKMGFIAELYGMSQDSLLIAVEKFDTSQTQSIYIKSMFRIMPQEKEIPNSAIRTDAYTEIIQKLTL